MKHIFRISFLFLLIPAIAFATETTKKHEKSREVSKTFKVSKDATLKVRNKYGNVNVSSWNRNSVQIDVKITVKGNNLSKVEDKLKEIQIGFDASSSLVEATTKIGDRGKSWSWWGNNNNKINFQIDYSIKIPVTNNADLSNEYGNILLDKLEGNANINCDYGKIIIGDLLGEQTNINIDYSKGSSVKSMKNGNINTDYSSLNIEVANDVKINSDYSNLDLDEAQSINFNADYGSISVENVSEIVGNGDYTGISVGKLGKKMRVSSDYGRIKVERLAKGFESVDINSEYASIKIGIASGVNFDFTIDLDYAGFKKGNAELFKSIEKNTKKYYEGKYNGGGNAQVTIRSQFGSVSFYDN